MTQYAILIPQYNDWEALNLLIAQLNKDVAADTLAATSLVIVDDCSTQEQYTLEKFDGKSVQIVRLWRNMGHQRAIAIGLSYVASEFACNKIIVMDADGEDAPVDINKLVSASNIQPDKIIFAHRTKRHEGFVFQFFYAIYKFVFRQLTGKVITFGNFCIMPNRRLQNLVRVSEIWNNFPGGVIKSRLAYDSVPIERGKRLAGKSKMNFVSLILHGLSTVSVLIDVTAVRLLIFSICMSIFAFLGIMVVLYMKLVSHIAIPGWTSSLGSAFFIVILQLLLISLFLVFMVLQYRTQQHFLPATQYKDFVEKVEEVQQ